MEIQREHEQEIFCVGLKGETLGSVFGGFEAEIRGEDLGSLSLGLGESGKVV